MSSNKQAPSVASDHIARYHLTTVGNGNLGSAGSTVPAYLAAGQSAGYAYTATAGSWSSGLSAGGKPTVSVTFKNSGNAPAYETWQAKLLLKNSGGTVVASAILPISLSSLLSSAETSQATSSVALTLPANLSQGNYSLNIQVVDPAGVRKPLNLGIASRQADGSYPIDTATFSSTAPITQPSTTPSATGTADTPSAQATLNSTLAASKSIKLADQSTLLVKPETNTSEIVKTEIYVDGRLIATYKGAKTEVSANEIGQGTKQVVFKFYKKDGTVETVVRIVTADPKTNVLQSTKLKYYHAFARIPRQYLPWLTGGVVVLSAIAAFFAVKTKLVQKIGLLHWHHQKLLAHLHPKHIV